MKLLKIEGSNSVDVVLIAVPDHFNKQEVLDKAQEYGALRGEIYIDEQMDLPASFRIDEMRPFVG
jgi:hypothetical protein